MVNQDGTVGTHCRGGCGVWTISERSHSYEIVKLRPPSCSGARIPKPVEQSSIEPALYPVPPSKSSYKFDPRARAPLQPCLRVCRSTSIRFRLNQIGDVRAVKFAPRRVLHSARWSLAHCGFDVMDIWIQPNPAGASVQPSVDLCYRIRMIDAVPNVTLLRLEHDDCQLREPLNGNRDTSHHILHVRKPFNFFNGCDMRGQVSPKTFRSRASRVTPCG